MELLWPMASAICARAMQICAGTQRDTLRDMAPGMSGDRVESHNGVVGSSGAACDRLGEENWWVVPRVV
jgi:hypothetical protein